MNTDSLVRGLRVPNFATEDRHGQIANLQRGGRTRHEIRQFFDNWISHLQFFV
jgi:hypothetical protein